MASYLWGNRGLRLGSDGDIQGKFQAKVVAGVVFSKPQEERGLLCMKHHRCIGIWGEMCKGRFVEGGGGGGGIQLVMMSVYAKRDIEKEIET